MHHRLLRRMQGASGPALQQRVCSQVFGCPERQPVNRMGHANATVDGLKAQCAPLDIANHHGAGAAVPLTATFLGAGATHVFAQHLEKGACVLNIIQRNHLASPDELNGLTQELGHKYWFIICMFEQF